MSTNNQLTPKQLEDLLKKYDNAKPFDRTTFQLAAATLALIPLYFYFTNIENVTSAEEILQHLFVIGAILLLAGLASLVLTTLRSMKIDSILKFIIFLFLFLAFCTICPFLPNVSSNEDNNKTENPNIVNIHNNNIMHTPPIQTSTPEPEPENPPIETESCDF